jgi:hypothetical protein
MTDIVAMIDAASELSRQLAASLLSLALKAADHGGA